MSSFTEYTPNTPNACNYKGGEDCIPPAFRKIENYIASFHSPPPSKTTAHPNTQPPKWCIIEELYIGSITVIGLYLFYRVLQH